MKAMILAAGLGTRLLPLTQYIPKCMIEIAGKPLIEHQINWLRENGITEIAINLHHLSDQVKHFLGDGSKFQVKIVYSFEEELLGTAGGVKKIESFFNDDFLVFYGDEYTNFNLSDLYSYHKSKYSFLTLCIRERPSGSKFSNIIKKDSSGRICTFIEKPTEEQVKSEAITQNLENCGIYICSKDVLDFIHSNTFCDFAKDVFPNILKDQKVYGFEMASKYLWYELGRLEKYHKYKPEIEKFIFSP